MKISTIISYCSLDRRFIEPLLKQVRLFSDDIIVVYYDKLMNSTPENTEEISSLLQPFGVNELCLSYTADNTPRYFHNLARWQATELAKHQHIMYLDADEIPEGYLFKLIADSDVLADHDAVDFECNWYFRSATNQAIQTEQCGLLINKNIINEKSMFTEHERWIYRHNPYLRYLALMPGPNGPLMHHYSWVRTREEMITKVSGWGHKNDRDWLSLIEKEFSHDFDGTDFVHGYSYRQVEDKFNIGL